MAKAKAKPAAAAVKAAAEKAKAALAADTPRVPPIDPADYLSTGACLFDLAVSGRPDGGIAKGQYVYFVGDSSSGKTWWAFQLAAELCRNPAFADYRIVYDASENGALMDLPTYFGTALAERIEPPRGTRDAPEYSQTLQDMYHAIDDALDAGPCLFIEDSMDALLDQSDEEQFEKEKAAAKAGKEATGSYGMGKAKTNSRNINRVVQRLRETGSILVLISQTRDKIGGMFPGQKTRGGGKSLRFYAHVEVWTSAGKPITVTHNGKPREIGKHLVLDVQKNRLTGWEGKITVPHLRAVGIDDLGASVDYLVDEGHWTVAEKKGKRPAVVAPEFQHDGSRESLIAKIEEEGGEAELRRIVAGVWRGIEAAVAPRRKPRYA